MNEEKFQRKVFKEKFVLSLKETTAFKMVHELQGHLWTSRAKFIKCYASSFAIKHFSLSHDGVQN